MLADLLLLWLSRQRHRRLLLRRLRLLLLLLLVVSWSTSIRKGGVEGGRLSVHALWSGDACSWSPDSLHGGVGLCLGHGVLLGLGEDGGREELSRGVSGESGEGDGGER